MNGIPTTLPAVAGTAGPIPSDAATADTAAFAALLAGVASHGPAPVPAPVPAPDQDRGGEEPAAPRVEATPAMAIVPPVALAAVACAATPPVPAPAPIAALRSSPAPAAAGAVPPLAGTVVAQPPADLVLPDPAAAGFLPQTAEAPPSAERSPVGPVATATCGMVEALSALERDGDGGQQDARAEPPPPAPVDAAGLLSPQPPVPAPDARNVAVAGTGPSGPVAPTAAPAAVPAQLVQVVAPFRETPDGTHHLTLRLRPDELGEVRVVVQVRAGEVSLHLTAESSGTADILRTSLPDLRAELEAGGFRAGSLDVGTGEQPPTRRHGRPDLAEPALGPAPPARATSPASGSGPAGLDIRL